MAHVQFAVVTVADLAVSTTAASFFSLKTIRFYFIIINLVVFRVFFPPSEISLIKHVANRPKLTALWTEYMKLQPPSVDQRPCGISPAFKIK